MERHHPQFSVVIPAYNAARWLPLTLESWAAQTFRDFEVIVVDDGSDDDTIQVAQAFADRLDLRIIRERHSGAPAHPCNVGIQAARGDVIVHCDADDLAAPDRLECIQQSWNDASRRDCLIISDFAEIDQHGKIATNSVLSSYSAVARAPREHLTKTTSLISPRAAFSALLEGAFVRPCSAATPRSVLLKIHGFDETLRNAQDYDLFLRIATEHPFVLCNRVLAQYRVRPGNISSRPPSEVADSKLAILMRLRRLPLTRSERKSVLRTISANYSALGYEFGTGRELMRSLRAYWQAFLYHPHWTQLRGMAASIAKFARLRRDRV